MGWSETEIEVAETLDSSDGGREWVEALLLDGGGLKEFQSLLSNNGLLFNIIIFIKI